MYTSLISIIMVVLINISSLLLAVWVFKSAPKETVNRWFLLMSAFIVLWVDSSFIASIVTDNNQLSTFAYRLNGAAVALFLYVFYIFFIKFLKIKKQTKIISYILFVTSVAFVFLSLFTNYMVQGVQVNQQVSEAVFGNFNNYFYIFACVVAILICYLALTSYIASNQIEKHKIKYFFIGILIFIVANILFNIIIPFYTGSSEYQRIGDFSFILFLGFTAYAIVKSHLFDVRLAIVRSVTYVLVLVSLAGVYIAIALILSIIFNKELINSWQTVGDVLISLVLAFLLQPLKLFFDKITNKVFYKDRYHTDDFYSRLNYALTLNNDLHGILRRAASEIATTLKCEQVFFFINTTNGHYVSAGTSHHKQLPKNDATKIGEFCGTDYHAVAASMLQSDNPLKQLMSNHGIEIVLPLTQSDKIVGYLCLGNNMASGYTDRDIKVLNMIADEMVIAVQNALSVAKVLELNSTLQQRINNATKELRIKNAQLRQLDKAKDEFVSVAAHELRTPMTVFRGFIGMLKSGQLGNVNPKQQELLDKMSNNTKNLIDLVNNMLDLSKLEADKLVIELSDNFLGDMVNRSLEKMSLLYESKGVALNYTNVSVRLKTDPDKFERVLVNLLSNAYKFTLAGGSVTVSCNVNEENRVATICVADTGLGIPPESINKLFKKFSQVDNYLQKTSGGTGLGLAICKQMVEKMGGNIWVESAPNVGSRFYFTMPMSEPLETIH